MKLYRIIGNQGRITIPFALRKCIGFQPDDVVSFEMISQDTVLVRREALHNMKEKPSEVQLKEFLETLSPSQQYKALVHLSVLWAEHNWEGGGC